MTMSFTPDTRVTISGLKGRPDLNSQSGTIMSYDASKGRYAVKVGGESVLLKPDALTQVSDDEDDGLALEENDDDDGLELEENPADDSDDCLALEENPADDDDDDELQLEGNDDDDELQLEGNDDDSDDGLALEENPVEDDDDDGLALEDNDDEEDGLALEENDDDDGLVLEEQQPQANDDDEDDGLVLEELVEEISTDGYLPRQNGYGVVGSAYDGFGGGFAGNGMSGAANGDSGGTADGLAEALKALQGGTGNSVGGPAQFAPSGVVNGQLIEPERFLIPSAKAKLEEAQMLYPQKEGATLSEWTRRLTQILTANDPRRCLLTRRGGWKRTASSSSPRGCATRRRPFAAGSYTAAFGAYSAGIEKHDAELGDSAHLMHCHVNRAAALLKLGKPEIAAEDADFALKIAEGCYAPKTQRKAYLRRAQALFELGKLDAAREDVDKLGADDTAGRGCWKDRAQGWTGAGRVMRCAAFCKSTE